MGTEQVVVHGRGVGRLTGRQLTTVICVATVAAVSIPTAALAATGAFTSTTAVPAVQATNSSKSSGAKGVFGYANATGNASRYGVIGKATGSAGVGVHGTGLHYGVYSNGPLGVAAGKSLSCTGCVGRSALAPSARSLPMGVGYNDPGIVFGIGPNDIPGAPAFVAPADATCLVTNTVMTDSSGFIPAGPVAEIKGAISVNGAPFAADDVTGVSIISSGSTFQAPAITVASTFSVAAGQTIRFAAWYNPLYVPAASEDAVVRQGYICS